MEILHASCAMRDVFNYDAVQHFVNNLTPGIKAEVKVNWTRHHTNLSHDRHVQMTFLAEAQIEATKAETKIGNLQGIIQGSTNTALFAHGIQGTNSACLPS